MMGMRHGETRKLERAVVADVTIIGDDGGRLCLAIALLVERAVAISVPAAHQRLLERRCPGDKKALTLSSSCSRIVAE
jgi:hypothetical protein